MQLQYVPQAHWPPLAWLATARVAGSVVEVRHGRMVETRDGWFCEAIWDGAFDGGDFDRTDIVFGSGGRLRGGSITFVSSGATSDRLHSVRLGERVWISNSLPCLLRAVGARLDPTRTDYFEFFKTIVRGIRRYERDLPTSVGPVRLTYFDNLEWDGESLSEAEKPTPARDFGSYAKYRAFLDASLARLAGNMSASGREHPFRMMGTLSSGYDSVAVASLARAHGMSEAISIAAARGGEPDSGERIAEALGVSLTLIARDAWQAHPLPEVPFIAVDAAGGDVFLRGAEGMLTGRVLLTGYQGGKVWGRKVTYGEGNVQVAHAGLALSEYRLWEGFLHCPVAAMGMLQVEDIKAISASAEMAPWDISQRYSRPIARRIAEEAGVPRNAFGIRKKAAAVLLRDRSSFLSPRSQAEYRRWLAHESGIERAQLRPSALRPLQLVLTPFVQGPAAAADRMGAGKRSPIRRLVRRLEKITQHQPLFRFVFPWAMQRAMERYGAPSPAGPPLREQPTRSGGAAAAS